jgi:hypothetical protein
MSCCTDNFDCRRHIRVSDGTRGSSKTISQTSPIECLMVWFCALEARQERVVYVDDSPAHLLAQFRAEDLHVPRQDDEIDLVFLDQSEDLSFLGFLCFWRHRHVEEWDVVGLCERSEGIVV